MELAALRSGLRHARGSPDRAARRPELSNALPLEGLCYLPGSNSSIGLVSGSSI
jgi:hypothetical protein